MQAALTSLRPPPKIRLSTWIESELYLSSGTALPGKIRLYPFQKGIADAISDPLLPRVSVLKSARIGYTTLLVGAIANYVVNDPSLILAVLPTEDDARKFVVSDIEPIFAESPALAQSISSDQKEGHRSTMLSRRFSGGALRVAAAKSPRNLRAHTARVVIMDEVDGMSPTAEGNPISLAEMRSLTFENRKIIVGSTPVMEETSYIIGEYEKSDKRIFEVQCVECDDFSEIVWKDIHWPEGEPEKAYWSCPKCGCDIEHKHKSTMVARGRWRITRPEVKDHAGFKINSLISPLANASWGKLAREFLSAKNTPEDLQVFVNTVLGEGWRGEGDNVDDEELSARAEPFGLSSVPEEVLAITVGVDVQRKDRLEATYVGWD